ncbi:hypothetical protein FACS189468_3310 [Spirochaetia bacterium]|nr:hypothetical protein FACS189468_3310 [Spirochaetia bacterium]
MNTSPQRFRRIVSILFFLSLVRGSILNAQILPPKGVLSGGAVYSQSAPEPPGAGAGTTAATGAGNAAAAGAGNIAETEAKAEDEDALRAASILEADIRTSSLTELADWCRSLGLSEGGDREELAARLRNHYQLSVSVPGGDGSGEAKRMITIESARSTEYFTLSVVDEEYARLRGDVVVSLQDGEAFHRIRAAEILYNRTRNTISASGEVEYVKTEAERVETFRGASITVNMDDWSTVFMQGITDHSLENGETSYRFAGEVISRSGENVTILKHAEITNGANEEAYWSVAASKLWLLPGSDWAISNAVLKVGEIPVLYIPFFYYPAHEIIFHPVLGFRTREGSFLQTTTYILGRPRAQASTENSIVSILGSGADTEMVREGVFLRSTGKKSRDPNTTRLSLLFDAYTNLGFYLGTELALPPKGILGELTLSGGLGFTRDITHAGGAYYTPFAPRYDGTSNWNSSDFFSARVPFRYRFKTEGSLSGNHASLSWSFPFYSDPYVDNDFLNRSEDSTIFSMLKQLTTTQATTDNTGVMGSYEWKLNSSVTFNLPRLAPYVSSLAITSLVTSVSFKGIVAPEHRTTPDWSRTFFYPDKVTLFSLNTAATGTLLNLGGNPAAAEEEEDEEEDSLNGFGIPSPPWDTGVEGETLTAIPGEFTPPPLNRQLVNPLNGGHQLTLDYRLNPSASSELQFNNSSANWKTSDDIDWGDTSSLLFTLRSDASTGLTLSEIRGLYTASVRFFGTASWQDYSFLNDEAPEYDTTTERDAARNRTYNNTYFTTSVEFGTTVKPFYNNEIWKNTFFQYTLRGLMVKSEYDATSLTSSGSPSWNIISGDWSNKNDIEIHRVQANFSALVMDKAQTLSLTADLPPEDSVLGGDATMRVWLSETNARTRIQDPFNDPFYEPIYFTETVNFTRNISFKHYMVYDPEVESFTTLTTSLTLGGLSLSFSAIRSKTYTLITDPTKGQTGWHEDPGPEILNPRELSIAYRKTYATDTNRKFAFSFNVDTGLTFDLQRYTSSKFRFTLGVGAKVTNFMDISLSSTSENAVVFRYFQNWPIWGSSYANTIQAETRMMVPAFLTNDEPRSSILRSTFPAVGRW